MRLKRRLAGDKAPWHWFRIHAHTKAGDDTKQAIRTVFPKIVLIKDYLLTAKNVNKSLMGGLSLFIHRTMRRQDNRSSPFMHVLRKSRMEGKRTDQISQPEHQLITRFHLSGLPRSRNGDGSVEVSPPSCDTDPPPSDDFNRSAL